SRGAITLPPDDSSAEVRLVARGIRLAPRVGEPLAEETTGRCPSPGDSARHGNARQSLSARRNERSPKRLTLDKHSSLTDLTQAHRQACPAGCARDRARPRTD